MVTGTRPMRNGAIGTLVARPLVVVGEAVRRGADGGSRPPGTVDQVEAAGARVVAGRRPVSGSERASRASFSVCSIVSLCWLLVAGDQLVE